MKHHLADLGWVDFDWNVPPILPGFSSHFAKDIGIARIKVNLTEEVMVHPAHETSHHTLANVYTCYPLKLDANIKKPTHNHR